MSEYIGIQGQAVINTGSDPSPNINGQVWYNNATYAFKISNLIATGAWATGGSLATARQSLAGAGTQTSGLAIGGSPYRVETEEYDGTSWSPGGNLGTGRQSLAAAGIQTATLGFGGFITPGSTAATEEYDGSAWTAGGNLGTARFRLAGCGTQTSGLGFGGATYPPPVPSTATEEYNGTSWTAGGNLGTARNNLAGAGEQTAGLAFGGGPSITGATEEFNSPGFTIKTLTTT